MPLATYEGGFLQQARERGMVSYDHHYDLPWKVINEVVYDLIYDLNATFFQWKQPEKRQSCTRLPLICTQLCITVYIF